jgi:hypothetical protein
MSDLDRLSLRVAIAGWVAAFFIILITIGGVAGAYGNGTRLDDLMKTACAILSAFVLGSIVVCIVIFFVILWEEHHS